MVSIAGVLASAAFRVLWKCSDLGWIGGCLRLYFPRVPIRYFSQLIDPFELILRLVYLLHCFPTFSVRVLFSGFKLLLIWSVPPRSCATMRWQTASWTDEARDSRNVGAESICLLLPRILIL